MSSKPKLLFLYESAHPVLVKDGLWAALQLLEQDFEITRVNMLHTTPDAFGYDFALGWGAFGSKVDRFLKDRNLLTKGLCIGGTAGSPDSIHSYDVVFYETQWDFTTRLKATGHSSLIHAFGINTDIYHPVNTDACRFIDVLTVGAYAYWKRLEMITTKPGVKLAVGEIQRDNLQESLDIIGSLLLKGCGVMDMVTPEKLALIYNATDLVYVPADINGGGERAVLEALACGCVVEVEEDNPKLKELLKSPVRDHRYYAQQLTKGIVSCLNGN